MLENPYNLNIEIQIQKVEINIQVPAGTKVSISLKIGNQIAETKKNPFLLFK